MPEESPLLASLRAAVAAVPSSSNSAATRVRSIGSPSPVSPVAGHEPFHEDLLWHVEHDEQVDPLTDRPPGSLVQGQVVALGEHHAPAGDE